MNKNTIFITVLIILGISISIFLFWYYHVRHVKFELEKVLAPPEHGVGGNADFMGFELVENENDLLFWLCEQFKKSYYRDNGVIGYDMEYAKKLSKELDYENYNYIITYNKEILDLQHSPYLTRHEDGLYFDERTPLFPTFYTKRTDKVYIYKIKNDCKYRCFGP